MSQSASRSPFFPDWTYRFHLDEDNARRASVASVLEGVVVNSHPDFVEIRAADDRTMFINRGSIVTAELIAESEWTRERLPERTPPPTRSW